MRSLAALTVVLGLVGLESAGRSDGRGLAQTPSALAQRFGRNAAALVSLPAHHDTEVLRLQDLRRRFDLPQIRQLVQDGTIDAFGHEQGMLFVNDMRVLHRPVFQSYSAYTPYLQDLNGSFYRGPGAPEWVLFKLQPIDGRFPAAEDSQALLALLGCYLPHSTERGYVLLRRRAVESTSPNRHVVLERRVRLGEWVDVEGLPGRFHELALRVERSLAGRLRTTLLRPPMLHLDVETADGTRSRFTIASMLTRAPFLLDPLVRHTDDVVALYAGRQLPRVARFCIDANRSQRGLGADITVQVLRQDDLVPTRESLTQVEREHVDRCLYPMLRTPLDDIASASVPTTVMEDDCSVLFVHAPAALRVTLPEGRHTLQMGFGILRRAYQENGATDGVLFRVSLVGNGAERELWRRLLDPLHDPADRGIQSLRLEVSAEHPAALLLRAETGPRGDGSWDWSYWSDLVLQAASAGQGR